MRSYCPFSFHSATSTRVLMLFRVPPSSSRPLAVPVTSLHQSQFPQKGSVIHHTCQNGRKLCQIGIDFDIQMEGAFLLCQRYRQ